MFVHAALLLLRLPVGVITNASSYPAAKNGASRAVLVDDDYKSEPEPLYYTLNRKAAQYYYPAVEDTAYYDDNYDDGAQSKIKYVADYGSDYADEDGTKYGGGVQEDFYGMEKFAGSTANTVTKSAVVVRDSTGAAAGVVGGKRQPFPILSGVSFITFLGVLMYNYRALGLEQIWNPESIKGYVQSLGVRLQSREIFNLKQFLAKYSTPKETHRASRQVARRRPGAHRYRRAVRMRKWTVMKKK